MDSRIIKARTVKAAEETCAGVARLEAAQAQLLARLDQLEAAVADIKTYLKHRMPADLTAEAQRKGR